MSTMELWFLGFVIFAFTAFGVVLAFGSWYERSGAARKEAETGEIPKQDATLRRAA